jgi:hypothetical protein
VIGVMVTWLSFRQGEPGHLVGTHLIDTRLIKVAGICRAPPMAQATLEILQGIFGKIWGEGCEGRDPPQWRTVVVHTDALRLRNEEPMSSDRQSQSLVRRDWSATGRNDSQ